MRWIGGITCFCWNLHDKGAVLLWGGVFATGGHHVGCALVCANERCAVRCYEKVCDVLVGLLVAGEHVEV